MSVLVMPYLQMISRSCSRRKGACESRHALSQSALSLALLGKRDTILTQHEGFDSGSQVSGHGGGNAGKGAGKTSSAKCQTHGEGTGPGAAQQQGKHGAQSRRNSPGTPIADRPAARLRRAAQGPSQAARQPWRGFVILSPFLDSILNSEKSERGCQDQRKIKRQS